jgi:hypothetical protein
MKEALFSFGRIYTPWTEDYTYSDDPEEGISEACAGFLYFVCANPGLAQASKNISISPNRLERNHRQSWIEEKESIIFSYTLHYKTF